MGISNVEFFFNINNLKIIDGITLLEFENENSPVIISKEFAEANILKISDVITLRNIVPKLAIGEYDENFDINISTNIYIENQINFQIVGLFESNDDSLEYNNTIFIPDTTARYSLFFYLEKSHFYTKKIRGNEKIWDEFERQFSYYDSEEKLHRNTIFVLEDGIDIKHFTQKTNQILSPKHEINIDSLVND